MARQPKPWYRKDRKVWCVTINGKRHSLGRNKKKAMEQFRALIKQPRPVRLVTTSPPLVAIVDEFLDWVARNRAEATFQWYQGRLQAFVDRYPDITVEQLKPYHVEKWAGNPCHSTATRRNKMRSIKRCLKWAVTQGYLAASPIANLEVPSAQSADAYLSPDEFARLLNYVPDPRVADLLIVTYETACRPQESLRVEARHVDLQHARWVFPPREAKNKTQPRIVYLSEHALKVSKQLMERWPSGPLFRNCNGCPWNKDSIGCMSAWARPNSNVEVSR